MLLFETALIEALADNRTFRVAMPRDVDALLHDIAAGRLPTAYPTGPTSILEVGANPEPFVRILGDLGVNPSQAAK
jgi:hypothetical protein